MRTLGVLLIVLTATGAGADEPAVDEAVREAIVVELRARLGTGAEVTIEALRMPAAWAHSDVRVRPDPGARLGRALRFSLGVPAARPGAAVRWTASAEADVQVAVEHLHARRAVSRGEVIGETDVEVVRHAVEGPLRPWPAAGAIGHSRALRDLEAGACLAPNLLQVLPPVRAGQDVQAIVRVAGIEAEARLVASDNGEIGSIVRVVNPQSRRVLSARVVGSGIVEVIP